MLEEIKATLVRKGVFEDEPDQQFEESKEANQRGNKADFHDTSNHVNALLKQYIGKNDTGNSSSHHGEEETKGQEDPRSDHDQKSMVLRFFLKFIYSLDIKVIEGAVRFFLTKEKIEIASINVKDFFQGKLDNLEYRKINECFSVSIEELSVDVAPSTNNEMIVHVESDSLMISNS